MTEILEQTSITSEEITKNISDLEPLPQYLRDCLELLRPPNMYEAEEVLIRCMYLNDGKVFFGIPLLESEDSFLVGAAARLVMNQDGTVGYDPLVPTSVMRIFKNTLKISTAAVEKFKHYYFLYLKARGFTMLPSYFTEERKQTVLDFIQTYEFENNLDSTNTDQNVFESQGIHGASDNAFIALQNSEMIH